MYCSFVDSGTRAAVSEDLQNVSKCQICNANPRCIQYREHGQSIREATSTVPIVGKNNTLAEYRMYGYFMGSSKHVKYRFLPRGQKPYDGRNGECLNLKSESSLDG